MLTLVVTMISYSILLMLGIICMFINETAWICLLPFFIYLLVLMLNYREGTCITLQYKDFIVVFISSSISFYLYQQINADASLGVFSYFYLITFLSSMIFINTIRFKSLI